MQLEFHVNRKYVQLHASADVIIITQLDAASGNKKINKMQNLVS